MSESLFSSQSMQLIIFPQKVYKKEIPTLITYILMYCKTQSKSWIIIWPCIVSITNLQQLFGLVKTINNIKIKFDRQLIHFSVLSQILTSNSMKSSSLKLSILLIMCVVNGIAQNSQLIVNSDQNSIEPTVVNPTPNNNQPNNENNQPQQPVPTPQTEHNQIQNEQPNAQMNGIQAQAVPINSQQTNNPTNQPPPQSNQQAQPQSNQQALAKAKQQAQKARQMAEQARRQAQTDRKSRDQQEDQQLRNIQSDQTLSKTQKKKQQERLMFRKVSRGLEKGTRFTEYLFEQGLGASEFFIKIPAAQQVAINLYTYVSQDNTYVRTKNIEEEEPVKIYIYENNQKIVYEGQFYYQSYIIFNGQAGAMYLIKVVNNGRTKLISMNCKKLVQEAHLEDTLQKHDGSHVQRTQNLAVQIHRWHQEFRKIRMLDFQDIKAVQGYIQKYYSWQIVETLIAVILCAVQIKTIHKMLQGSSIV